MSEKRVRCAIYTRKSTEEGLQKEFNTLEAQREACESYIKSQMHEGWVLIPTDYDDGGYTGGNMDRPALQALMADIKAGKVDTIVVYKVDRLSRSLHDFARMVTVFDDHKVSFVSITQQFNTTTSMGRLTLNILLSFAQFEREVIGERVRDKIAASKRKGMWIGGKPPLGYDIEHRKLVVNLKEAALVKEIYERYLTMKSAQQLTQRLGERGELNKRWINRFGVAVGGQPFCYQAIYKILNNPIYIGLITHKDKTYKGQHQGIIEHELWDRVQKQLKTGREHWAKRHSKHGSLLMGKCFSATGNFYTPTHTNKGGKQYRYYIEKKSQRRIKAIELESLVIDTVRLVARHPKYWHKCWSADGNARSAGDAMLRWKDFWAAWSNLTMVRKQELGRQIIQRVTVTERSLTVRLCYEGILKVIAAWEHAGREDIEALDLNIKPDVQIEVQHMEIMIPARFAVHGCTQHAVDEQNRPIRTATKKAKHNPVLINALAKSCRWNQQLARGEATISELAKQERVSRTYISRMVGLMLLSPDIIASIMEGTQPATLHLNDLTANLPIEWHRQKQVLKF